MGKKNVGDVCKATATLKDRSGTNKWKGVVPPLKKKGKGERKKLLDGLYYKTNRTGLETQKSR